jgi:hypothetical protein
MNKKEIILLSILSIAIILCIVPLISAQFYGGGFSYIDLGQGVRDVIDQMTNLLTPVFEVLLGDYSGSNFFFTKILLLIVLFVLINTILKRIPAFEGNNGVVMIISLVVSIIAIRFISEDQLYAIILPYSVLGIALTSILPFMIFAYFIYSTDMPGIGRKFAWLFFIAVFGVTWFYKWNELTGFGNTLYFWTAVVMGGMFLFDRSIQAYLRGENIKDWEKKATDKEIAALQEEAQRIAAVDSVPADRRRRQIKQRLWKLGAGSKI